MTLTFVIAKSELVKYICKRTSDTASCPEGDYYIELVETRDGAVIWLWLVVSNIDIRARHLTRYDRWYAVL